MFKGLTQGLAALGGGGKHGPLGGAVESALGTRIVGLAHKYLGTPYVWGGRSPKGFDCSGFAQYLYGQVGVSIPPTTYTQWKAGRSVGKSQLQPGDLVFFRGSDSIGGLPGHVGVYIGHGMMIDAPHTGSHVRVESVFNFGGYMGARRYGKG
jgi:cell wall-associated NlpC family hydrolase